MIKKIVTFYIIIGSLLLSIQASSINPISNFYSLNNDAFHFNTESLLRFFHAETEDEKIVLNFIHNIHHDHEMTIKDYKKVSMRLSNLSLPRLKLLLEYKYNGHTPLHHAIIYKNYAAFYFLLNAGAAINAKTDRGLTIGDIADYIYSKASEKNNLYFFKNLFLFKEKHLWTGWNLDINEINTLEKIVQKDLTTAIEKPLTIDWYKLKETICFIPQERQKKIINQYDINGWTLLHWAVLEKNIILIAFLMQQNVNSTMTTRFSKNTAYDFVGHAPPGSNQRKIGLWLQVYEECFFNDLIKKSID